MNQTIEQFIRVAETRSRLVDDCIRATNDEKGFQQLYVEKLELLELIDLLKGEKRGHVLNNLAVNINNWAKSKGWNEGLSTKIESLGVQCMNFHSEITEAWEELRKGKEVDEVYYKCDCGCTVDNDKYCDSCMKVVNAKPEGFPIELADLLIRVLHTAGHYGLDMDELVRIKMEYNKTRAYRHGGKKA